MITKKVCRCLLQAHVIVVALALSLMGVSFVSAGDRTGRGGATPTVQPQQVNLPMQQPLPAMGCYIAPQKAPLCAPAKIRPLPPKPASSFSHLLPLEIRDAGPIKPLVAHTIGLAGAVIAAPFRLLETVAPIGYVSGYAAGSQPLPRSAPACFTNAAPLHALPSAGSPIMQTSRGYGQRQSYPTSNGSPSSHENAFPQMEPHTLLGGIVQFPSTMVRQGRILGDLGVSAPCAR